MDIDSIMDKPKKRRKRLPNRYGRKMCDAVHQRIKLLKEIMLLKRRPNPHQTKRAVIQKQRTIRRHAAEEELRSVELFLITEVTKDVLKYERDYPRVKEERRIKQKQRRLKQKSRRWADKELARDGDTLPIGDE